MMFVLNDFRNIRTNCMIYKLIFSTNKRNLTDVCFFWGVFLNTATERFMPPADWKGIGSSCEW